MTPRKRYYRFGYFIPPKTNHSLKPHQLRDGDALLLISNLLNEAGYEYGGIVFNPPAPENPLKDARKDAPKDAPKRLVDTSFLQPDDLIVLTTRPPLHDRKSGTRKTVKRSDTTLEDQIFKKLEIEFYSCSRLLVELSDDLASRLPPEYATRASIGFGESNAAYKSWRCHRTAKWQDARTPERTAFYLVYLPKTSETDLSVLCLFGMGGAETLIWSHFLRTRFHDRLSFTSARFIMAEMIVAEIPEPLHDFSFADAFEVRIVLDTTLP